MRRWLVLGFALLLVSPLIGCKALARKLTRRSPTYSTQTYDQPAYDSPTSAPAPGASATSIFGGTIAPNGDWWTYSQSTPARFSVLLPALPKESTENIPSELGLIPQHQAMASRGTNEVYIVAWMDLPGTNALDPKAVLDGARNGAVANVPSGRLRSERSLKLGGTYPGREIVIDITQPSAIVMTGHLYLVGRRFYQLQIVVPKSAASGVPMERFFSSLTVQ